MILTEMTGNFDETSLMVDIQQNQYKDHNVSLSF